MGRPPKHYSDTELAALRDRRNELRREQYRLDGGKRKAENQIWKDEHREQVRAAGRDYQRRRRELDPEGFNSRQREYRRKNPEKSKARYQKWYQKNGAEYSRGWHAANRVKNPTLYMWRNAKNRAKRDDIDFSIERSDIVVPEHCPVLGIKLEWGHGKKSGFFAPDGPSIDRFDSTKGYVPGNIRVISNRANWLKRDGTLDEFRKIVAYMERG